MTEIEQNKKGLSSFIIRLIAVLIMTAGIVSDNYFHLNYDWLEYISWIPFPIFAFLLAEGFTKTTNKAKYFIRFLLFALIAEIPYDYLYSGKLFNTKIHNGMLTLCLGFAVLLIVDFAHRKLNNLIITCALIYGLGLGAYALAKMFGFEFYSFGIMFILLFWVSINVKYTKLFQLFFLSMIVFYVSSETFLKFIVGNIQYSVPFRAYAYISMLLIWIYNGKRGPNKLWLKILMYLYYPLLLGAVCIAKLML